MEDIRFQLYRRINVTVLRIAYYEALVKFDYP
jgi:hypothetical protein